MKTEVVALIPARGGSKGIPRKNLALLGGKPLVAHTIEAARRCPIVDRVVLSTEDEGIAAAGREFGADVPFLRPRELASDRSLVNEAVFYTLARMERDEGYRPTHYLLLYPTSPFRTRDLLLRVLEPVLGDFFYSMTATSGWAGACSFADLEGGFLRPLQTNVTETAIYTAIGSAQACTVIDLDVLGDVERSRRWIHAGRLRGDQKCLNLFAFVEPGHPAEEIDIDTPEDLAWAEEVLRRGYFHE